MISHKNVIANVLQMATFEGPWRKSLIEPGNQSDYTENVLGLVSLTTMVFAELRLTSPVTAQPYICSGSHRTFGSLSWRWCHRFAEVRVQELP